jgi:hypothetical protein
MTMSTSTLDQLEAHLFGAEATPTEAVVGIGDAELRAMLAARPAVALRLLHDEEANRRLRRLGLRIERAVDELRAAIDGAATAAAQSGAIDPSAAAFMRLFLASALKLDGQPAHWMIASDVGEGRRREIIGSLAAGRFDEARGLQPAVVLRLLLEPRFAALRDPWSRGVAADAVRAALAGISTDGSVPLLAQVRCAALMAAERCRDDDFELEELLAAAGIDAPSHDRMLREIKGGTGAGSLFAAGVAPDYERLEKNPRFKEAAERLGYRFQPAVMRLRGQLERDLPGLTDPWVRWVHEEALGSGPDGERALSLLQQLGPARKERSAVLDGLLRSGGIRSGRAERVVQSEIPATGGSLEIRVFRALFMAVRVSGSMPAVPDKLRNWFLRAEGAYVSGASSLEAQEAVLARLVGALKDEPENALLRSFRDEVKRELASRELDAAREAGRSWLVALVDWARANPTDPTAWDGRRGVLIAEDVRRLAAWLERGQAKDWFKAPLDDAEEFRMKEAAFAVGKLGEPEFRTELAERVRSLVDGAAALNAEERSTLRELVEQCMREVLRPGSAAPSARVLEAFRRLDPREMLRAAERPAVVLPRGSRPVPLVGAIAGSAMAIVAIALGCLAWDFRPWHVASAAAPPASTAPTLEPWSANVALDSGWRSLPGGAGYWRRLKADDELFTRFVPPEPGRAMQGGDVTSADAQAWCDRFQKHLAVVDQGGKVEVGGTTLERYEASIRLPRATAEIAGIAAADLPVADRERCWTGADRAGAGRDPFLERPLVVILDVERRGGARRNAQ